MKGTAPRLIMSSVSRRGSGLKQGAGKDGIIQLTSCALPCITRPSSAVMSNSDRFQQSLEQL